MYVCMYVCMYIYIYIYVIGICAVRARGSMLVAALQSMMRHPSLGAKDACSCDSRGMPIGSNSLCIDVSRVCGFRGHLPGFLKKGRVHLPEQGS